jgi:hypothetical protein
MAVFADARLADEDGGSVPAAEHLDHPFDFVLAP